MSPVDGMSILLREVLDKQNAMACDISSIRETLAEQRGQRKVAFWIAGSAGAAAPFVLHIIGRVLGIPNA